MSTPELSYRETQFGVRRSNGEIQPVAMGPAEAERYRASGLPMYSRQREVYLPVVDEWTELAAATPGPTEETA